MVHAYDTSRLLSRVTQKDNSTHRNRRASVSNRLTPHWARASQKVHADRAPIHHDSAKIGFIMTKTQWLHTIPKARRECTRIWEEWPSTRPAIPVPMTVIWCKQPPQHHICPESPENPKFCGTKSAHTQRFALAHAGARKWACTCRRAQRAQNARFGRQLTGGKRAASLPSR